MLYGIDVSHWNYDDKALQVIMKKDFVLIKATEGQTYIDPCLHDFAEYALMNSKLIGFYHYCSAYNGNTPEKEAINFISSIRTYIGKAILAIDVESDNLNYKYIDDWVSEFCQYVYVETGVRPLIYIQRNALSKFKKVASENVGLWLAHWTKDYSTIGKIGNVSPFNLLALRQYDSPNNYVGKSAPIDCDLDVFYGNEEQFLKYAECKELYPKCTHCPIHCPN